jgi:hypothetical protein
MRSEEQLQTKLLNIWTNINIHAGVSMIVILCEVVQIFAIPDSHLLAFVQVARPWIIEREGWGMQSIAMQIGQSIPSTITAKLYQSWRRVHYSVLCICKCNKRHSTTQNNHIPLNSSNNVHGADFLRVALSSPLVTFQLLDRAHDIVSTLKFGQKKDCDVDNLISTLLWRCFTNIGSTSANRRWINVHSWFNVRRRFVNQSQRCFNVDSTLNYGWRDWQPNFNVVSTSKQ